MEIKKHIYSEQEAYIKLSALCASAEYCEVDMRKKMMKWELVSTKSQDDDETPRSENDNEEIRDRIIARLRKDRFIDDSRYAHAFVRDKFRYNHWGKVRITHELKMRKIAGEIINEALEEIPEDDNLETLRTLIENKRKSVKGKSEYEINGKLIRFALGRGFQMDDILKVVNYAD